MDGTIANKNNRVVSGSSGTYDYGRAELLGNKGGGNDSQEQQQKKRKLVVGISPKKDLQSTYRSFIFAFAACKLYSICNDIQ